MIKVLYLPLNVSGGKQSGMLRGFDDLEFVEMREFDFYGIFESSKNVSQIRHQFVHTVSEFQPDLIHCQLQMTGIFDVQTMIQARRVCRNKVMITNFSGDVRDTAHKHIVEMSPSMDKTFISSVGQLDLYRKAGTHNVEYWQIGYDENIFYPEFRTDFQYDLCFLGSSYAPTTFQDAGLRTNIVTELKNRLGSRMIVHGSGYSPAVSPGCVGTIESNKVYNSSRVIFSMSNYNDISNYFSDRLLTCMGTGRPVISYRFPDYQTYFSDNEDILIANSVDTIMEKLYYCIQNPEFANEIGYNGYLKARSEHTYHNRIIELLTRVGLLK